MPFASRITKTPSGRTWVPAAGEGRLAEEHQRVEQVTVAAEYALDEPVVVRVSVAVNSMRWR
jgi:hypothetical protein